MKKSEQDSYAYTTDRAAALIKRATAVVEKCQQRQLELKATYERLNARIEKLLREEPRE